MNKKIYPFLGSYPVSQAFGNMDVPDPMVYTKHEGTDYAVPYGTPLLAMDDGLVTIAGPDPYGEKFKGGFGYEVQIVYTDRTIGLLAHMSRIDVKVNQQVRQGQCVGLSGNSGFSTGAHAHVGLKSNGVWVDPENVLVQWSETVTPTTPSIVVPDVILHPNLIMPLGKCDIDPLGTYVVTHPMGLNVRAGYSTNDPVLFGLDPDQHVQSVTEHTDDAGNHWLGFVVWCCQEYQGEDLARKV